MGDGLLLKVPSPAEHKRKKLRHGRASRHQRLALASVSVAGDVWLAGQHGEVVDGHRQEPLSQELLLDRHQVPLGGRYRLVQEELDDHAGAALQPLLRDVAELGERVRLKRAGERWRGRMAGRGEGSGGG